MSDPTRPPEPDDPGTATDAGRGPTTPPPTPLPTSAEAAPTFDLQPGAAEPPPLPNPFGRYAILRRLGRGGMGTVYLARDTQLDRLVALKVPQFEAGDRALLRERFYREARAAALLHHPNI